MSLYSLQTKASVRCMAQEVLLHTPLGCSGNKGGELAGPASLSCMTLPSWVQDGVTVSLKLR